MIEIKDSRTHPLDIGALNAADINNELGNSILLTCPLIIRAADGERPVIELACPLAFRPAKIVGADAAEQALLDAQTGALFVRLEGLYIARGLNYGAGLSLISRAAINKLEILSCTLDPGGFRRYNGSRAPLLAGINLKEPYGFTNATDELVFKQTPEIVIQRSVSGAVFTDEGYSLCISDSIIESIPVTKGAKTFPFAIAGAANPATGFAGAATIRNVTVLGRVCATSIEGAGGIFTGVVEVFDQQLGCLKYCYFADDSVSPAGEKNILPQHFACVYGGEARLVFTSEYFGAPGYCQLSLECNPRIMEEGVDAATADPKPDPVPAAGVEKKPDTPKKPGRTWAVYPTRFGGGSYKVDATDPANIFAKVKVNLVPGGDGTWEDVKNIKKLEDRIEKHASRKGFTLNLEFVNPDNKPDFVADAETVKINANPRWPNATNWGGNALACAHELFHVLNFPLDRYNYIESHTTNQKMAVSERLTWFLEQMHKPEGFDNPESLMASGQYPIDEDICTIAQLDMATCLKAREKLKETKLNIRTPLGFTLPTAGYANIGGSSGLFLNYGLDLGIPLTYKGDWELFVGAHGTFLNQLEGDKRMAFLLGARVGIENMRTPGKGGLSYGLFAEGGAAFVSDKESLGSGQTFKAGGYGYGGLNIGYKLPPDILNISINAEIAGGITGTLGLHDPNTFVADPKRLPFFTAGLRAAWMF